MDKKKLLVIGIIVYLASSATAFGVSRVFAPKIDGDLVSPESLITDSEGNVQIDPGEPKTESCPLNGMLFTKTERAIWERRRPLAVMIENHTDSRPQSGLGSADIVYEAVAEGGITRFMGVFYCGIAANNTNFSPVRSARTYYLDWVSEYDALYAHVGGAGKCNDPTVDEKAKALCQIDRYGIKDMDQFGISYPTCYRNPDRLGRTVATEHTMVCSSNGLYTVAESRDWTNVDEDGVAWNEDFRSWEFSEGDKAQGTPDAAKISFGFWDGYKDFNVVWDYDKASNSYKRTMGGEAHADFETKKQITAKNVVVQLTKEAGPVDEHKHLLYETIGTGDAFIFKNGEAIEGTWSKKKRTARTLFYDEDGEEIQFVPGQIWIEVVPKGKDVDF